MAPAPPLEGPPLGHAATPCRACERSPATGTFDGVPLCLCCRNLTAGATGKDRLQVGNPPEIPEGSPPNACWDCHAVASLHADVLCGACRAAAPLPHPAPVVDPAQAELGLDP